MLNPFFFIVNISVINFDERFLFCHILNIFIAYLFDIFIYKYLFYLNMYIIVDCYQFYLLLLNCLISIIYYDIIQVNKEMHLLLELHFWLKKMSLFISVL